MRRAIAMLPLALLPACSWLPFGNPWKGRPPDELLAEASGHLDRYRASVRAGEPDDEHAERALDILDHLREEESGVRDRATLDFLRVEALAALGDRHDTYTAATEFAERHPVSARRPEIERILFDIGNSYEQGGEGFLGLGAGRSRAIPVYMTLAEHFSSGELADDALRLAGKLHFDEGDWAEARAVYERIVKIHPGSEWADLAEFRVAVCHLREVAGPSQDRGSMRRAREGFEGYLRNRPEGGHRAEAAAGLETALDLLAEREWRTAEFYRRVGNDFAANHHWRVAAESFPGTAGASKSRAALAAGGVRPEATPETAPASSPR